MTRDFVIYAPCVLLWAAAAYRLPAVRRRPGDRRLRASWFATLSFAAAATVLLPPVYGAINRLAGVPNLARLLGNGLVLVAAWHNQAFLFSLNYPDAAARQRARRAGWVLLGALALLFALFALAAAPEEAWDFTGRYAAAPYVLEYRLVYLAYLGLALVDVVRLAWRYAGLASRPALDLGLRLVAVGGAVGLAYVVHECLYAASRRLGTVYLLPDPSRATEWLIAVAVLLLVVGSTMPAWGARVGIPALYDWAWHYRAYQRLYPLWLALYRAAPEIALFPARSRLADRLRVWDVHLHLRRRVVEICDGRLLLRPFLDLRVVAHARAQCRLAGLSDDETRVVVEVVWLRAALRAREAGQEGGGAALLPEIPAGADVETAAAFFAQVARCLAQSPVVREIVAGLDSQVSVAGRRA